MRVEIRKSGEHAPKCEECGATELVELPDGRFLERDILALFEKHALDLEKDLLNILDDARRSDAEKFALDLASRLQEPEAKRWRFAKRKWQMEVKADIDEAIASLKDDTRF